MSKVKEPMITFKEFVKNPIDNAKHMSIKKLESYLRKLSDIYYNTQYNLVSDKVFDELKDILSDRDPSNKFLNKIGAPITKDKVKLPFPMGSLDKLKPTKSNEFERWTKTYLGPYELSDKMDGISALLHKKNGVTKLYSRGDGTYGQDITHLIGHVDIDSDKMPNGVAVRGELIMSRKNFEKVKKNNDKLKNARNVVAGVVNAKIVDGDVARYVDFVAYNVVEPRYFQNEQYEHLEEWGFNVVHHKEVHKITIDGLSQYFKKRREKSEYDIDGIVVMDNNMVYDVVEGNPEYGFAFKSIMDDQYAMANVVDVEWAVSRHNYIKPRVKIDPIDLVGVTITYATAHNAKFIHDNKIGPGSKIKIIRSGDVIPKIMEVISPSSNGKPKMPQIPYIWTDTGVDIIMDGGDDDNKTIVTTKKLVNTMKILGVKYVDEGIMKKIVDNGYNTFIKLLDASREDIVEIIGDKMTRKIFDGIDEALRNTQLHTLMAASNYFGRGIGEKKLKVVVKYYPNIMNEKWNNSELIDKINSLEGFQEKTTDKFVKGFSKFKKFFNNLDQRVDIGYLKNPHVDAQNGIFAGKKIVLTGFRDAKIIEFIEKNNGDVMNTVSKNTTFVVCIDKTTKSAKLESAKKFKIPLMTKNEFVSTYMA